MIRNLLIALTIVSTATAQKFSPYVSLSGGPAFSEAKDNITGTSERADSGGVIETAVGLAFWDEMYSYGLMNSYGLRAELALSFQADTYEDPTGDVEVETGTAMINGYLDIYTESPLTPYFLVGLGRANVEVDLGTGFGSDDAYMFAYQVGGGVGYSIGEHIILDLKYKYFGTEEYQLLRFNSHQVQFGVRYQF
jgi:opacity protein-like surface antigen